MVDYKLYQQFTFIAQYKGKIVHRWLDSEGTRHEEYVDFKPTLYEECNFSTGYKTIYGGDVNPITSKNIWAAGDLIKKYKIGGRPLHGQQTYHNQFIRSHYPGDIKYDSELMVVANVDIETYINDPDSPGGNPLENPIEGVNAITAIAVNTGKLTVIFGYKDFTGELEEGDRFVRCQDEPDLLDKYLLYWKKINPDVMTGWNIDRFDIPYLVGRIDKVLGDGASHRLSPVGIKIRQNGVTVSEYDGGVDISILGITILDYITIYKAYVKAPRERYSLNYIAHVELNDAKIDYSEFENLDDLYNRDYNKYIIYNSQDTKIVNRLDAKLQLLALINVFTYMQKMPHCDAMSQVPAWDAYIYNTLADEGVVVPEKHIQEKPSSFEGAYVLPVVVGLHKWIISSDLNSLYPSIMRTLNLGPEMIVQYSELIRLEEDGNTDATVLLGGFDEARGVLVLDMDHLVAGNANKYLVAARNLGYSVAGNGAMFHQNKQSFLSRMMEKLYNERRIDKNTMLYHEGEVERIKSELKSRA